MPILIRLGDDIGTEIAAGPSPVLHHDVLAEAGLEPLPEKAAGEIHGSPWRKRHDEADGTCREVERLTMGS
jgi:hypothetical protein